VTPPADPLNGYSWQELADQVRTLTEILTAVRDCEEGDGRCRLCAHCVTRLYVVAKPPPMTVPARYTVSPWRKR
jgi:hypothetical protein